MGRAFAEDLSATLPIESAIGIHLRGNHYPPIPLEMVQPCIKAIDLVNAGNGEELVDLPPPVLWKGNTKAPAYAIVEAHHLDSWIVEDYEDYM